MNTSTQLQAAPAQLAADACTSPIHAIVVISTVDGKPTVLMLDADATGTAVCRNWAQQLGVQLIDMEPSSPGAGRSKGRVENIHQLIERHLKFISSQAVSTQLQAAPAQLAADACTSTTDLLPCPFCGAQPAADVFENEACPANVCAVGNTGEEAAALWNTRNGGAA